MKHLPLISVVILLSACGQQAANTQLQNRMDNLQQQLNNTYKPGLGEFMSGIQLHHAKLWFAGVNNNWKLANFEIDEIKETIEDIQKYDTDKPEVKSISMIVPAIDSVSNAISSHNIDRFKTGYILLTNTCNNCHNATNHEFNIITIPSALPVTNQKL
jgi:hypothetical protein